LGKNISVGYEENPYTTNLAGDRIITRRASILSPHYHGPPPSTQRKISTLIIAIACATVFLTIVLSTHHPPFIRDDGPTPKVNMTVNQYNGDFYLHVESIDQEGVNITHVNWILLDNQSRAVPGEQGSVKDIYGSVIAQPDVNVSFKDSDGDHNFTVGDYFVIKGVRNGGQAEAGYSLLLKYDLSGDKMNGGGTKLG